jgi:hypothetical protein
VYVVDGQAEQDKSLCGGDVAEGAADVASDVARFEKMDAISRVAVVKDLARNAA